MSEKRVGLRWGASDSRIFCGDIIAFMQPAGGTKRRRRTIRLDVALLATAGILLVAAILPQVDPDLNIVMRDRTLDVALSALTLVAVTGLAVLTMMRYRETGRLAVFLQSSAFVLWAIFTAVTLLLIIFRLDGRLGMSLGLPEQLPAWVSGAVRISVAVLFMVSGIAALLSIYGTRQRVRRVFLPVAGIVVLTVAVYPVRQALPALIEPEGIEALLAAPGEFGLLPGFTSLALATVVATVTGLVAAVVLYRMTWARGGPMSDAFTAMGLVILAVAEVQYALWPSVYTGLVTISDMMRLVAYTVLVAGTIADQRSDLRALRSAYSTLDRMRVNEAERATLEERARLAREIHDGLAQHLWFAKLKFERLSGTLSEDDKPLAAEVTQALDAAIVEAREALVTMRSGLEEDIPFSDMLARTIDDFESRSGLRVDYRTSGVPARLAPRVQVELLRIVSEALNNVRKHADATTVRIRAEVSEGELLICIADNGRGFAQEEAFDRGLGLQGMRERARLIGGSLLIRSEISGGTTVEVRAPATAPRVPAMPTVTETEERTPMAADETPADLRAGPDAGTSTRPSSTPPLGGASSAPDGRPKSVQT
jgi:signal transduction histidine kinase